MDLLKNEKLHRNLLPYDGTVVYFGQVFCQEQATVYFDKLMQSIEWRHDEAVIFGKHITTKRKVAWYGDQPFSYTYSKTTKFALPWTCELVELKQIIEQITGEIFNSCLLNLYHDGSEGMAWHSDGEVDLKKNGAIASLSFGADRKFTFKHKTTQEKVELFLVHGSLLVMQGKTQTHWLHRLPTSKKINHARINLTFRQIDSKQV